MIDQTKLQIREAIVFDKNGAKYTHAIKNFVPNRALTDGDFVFNKAKYPGVEVVDMRQLTSKNGRLENWLARRLAVRKQIMPKLFQPVPEGLKLC